MKSTLATALLCALACGLPTAQAAGLVSIEWSADGRFAHELTVPGHKFAEACGKLPAGTRVDWTFEAGAPMDFNIHFHEGKEVRFAARQDGIAGSAGTLQAPVEQDYCWMWSNKSAHGASLKVQLQRRKAQDAGAG
ncbi:hypothetical protein [Ideonella sp. YS5]|uniref:hypothetical protein n=1 Tax=Ideonella sp. YS5 TaxID=3453714 RepID=UPI003EEC96F3